MLSLLLIFLSVLFLCIFCWHRRRVSEKFAVNFHQKYVLITGCDSGIGRLLTLQLSTQGIPVFACCLTQTGADSLRQEAAKRYKKCSAVGDHNSNYAAGENCDELKLWTPIFDVRKDEDAAEVEVFVGEIVKDQGLWAIVCNAGILGLPVPDDWLSVKDYEATLSVNTLGAIRTCQRFKKYLRKTGGGRIVLASSCLGQAAMPYIGPYTVSKFALEAYADTLRIELRQQGITVHTIVPGFYSTELTDEKRIYKLVSSAWLNAASDVTDLYGEEYVEIFKEAITRSLVFQCSEDLKPVIDAYFHALTARHPCRRYRVGWDSFGFLILSLVPAWLQDLFNTIFWKVYIGVPNLKKQLIVKKYLVTETH